MFVRLTYLIRIIVYSEQNSRYQGVFGLNQFYRISVSRFGNQFVVLCILQQDVAIHPNNWMIQIVSDSCLTPNDEFFSSIVARTSYVR